MIKIRYTSITLIVVGIVILAGFLMYRYVETIKAQVETLKVSNSQLNQDKIIKDNIISSQNMQIVNLKSQIDVLNSQLTDMTNKYEQAKPYQERVNRGQNLNQYYTVLGDYDEYTKPLMLKYLGLTKPATPANDNELWLRGQKVYNWISDNFEYCGDKGLRVGSTFYQFQFWSPDELLMSDNARCGDCDDFATLYAGMMYASGVPENKVWVICGTVPSGGHCWDRIVLSNQSYRVDPVCSQKQTVLNLFGWDLGIKGAYYTTTKGNVDCFDQYNEQMIMNPNGFSLISQNN